MQRMNNPVEVKNQYKDAGPLTTRLSLHQKYSVNSYGFHAWLFDQYTLSPGNAVLELGCGTGETWRNRFDRLPPNCTLTLTDLSEGMVETVTAAIGPHPGVHFAAVDIQDIPYEDDSFEVVIANYMLYHVPDQLRALREIRRVLKPGGRFYAAAAGITKGIHAYVRNVLLELNPRLEAFKPESVSFTLENGTEILNDYFDSVELRHYEDSLAIPVVDDLMAWLRSTITMFGYDEASLTGLAALLEQKKEADGMLHIPKDSGLFVAQLSPAL